MKRKHLITITLILVIVITVLLTQGLPLFAQNASLIKQNYYAREDQIKKLNEQIKLKQSAIDNFKEQQDEYQSLIDSKQSEALDLASQINELDIRIAKAELDIERTQAEIDILDLEISNTNEEISRAEAQITSKKEKIAEFIRKIHTNDTRNYLQMLLLDESFSDFFNHLQNLENIESEIIDTLNEVKLIKSRLEVDKITIEDKRFTLSELKAQAEQQQFELEDEKVTREIILEETENSEEKFQELLVKVRENQESANYEIKILENEVREKLTKHKFNFDLDPSKIQLIWPIPNQGITTIFHDPDYPFRRWIGEHSGIDLRTLINGRPSNGVKVRSAASGVVIKIIRGGRYVGNAVYIAHSDNVLTVYLHLSKVNVTEDEFIPVGGIIGLSGGNPGTPGAGFSTGPHLHFEVRINGIPVDPLEYLP